MFAAADYTGVPADITFSVGSTAGSDECVDITLEADGVVENDVENLLLLLTTEEERVVIGNGVTTLSIMDVDSELSAAHCVTPCHILYLQELVCPWRNTLH